MVLGLHRTRLLLFSLCSAHFSIGKQSVFPSDFNGNNYFINIMNTTIALSTGLKFLIIIFSRNIWKAGAQVHFHSVLNVFIYKIAFYSEYEQNECAN